MSECVVRMEMPKDGVCDGCDARTFDILAGPICAIYKKFLGSSRPSWCPIICSLSEGHGRLIDADALKEKAVHYSETEYHFDHDAVEMDDIDDAPTIVPAEKGESKDANE